MRIIKFKNLYAIRVFKFDLFDIGYKYIDLNHLNHTWDKKDCYFNECLGTYKRVKDTYDFLKDKGVKL